MIASLLLGQLAAGHSASDAYLTLSAPNTRDTDSTALHGQWDIALRDLDFVLKLDANDDGQISWGEAKNQQRAIERYALAHLAFVDQNGKACSIKPSRFMIDRHADGAYAALFFDLSCVQTTSTLTLKYSLFFQIDPSHRGIFVFRTATTASTALLSPENSQIPVYLAR